MRISDWSSACALPIYAAAQATASESVHAASPPIRRAECCADRAGARTGARTGRSLRQRVDRRQVAALLVEVHAIAAHVARRHLAHPVVGADAIDATVVPLQRPPDRNAQR